MCSLWSLENLKNQPLWVLYLAAVWLLIALDVISLSDSEPSVSYSVIGMWSVKIFLTSESVEPGLSDSINRIFNEKCKKIMMRDLAEEMCVIFLDSTDALRDYRSVF